MPVKQTILKVQQINKREHSTKQVLCFLRGRHTVEVDHKEKTSHRKSSPYCQCHREQRVNLKDYWFCKTAQVETVKRTCDMKTEQGHSQSCEKTAKKHHDTLITYTHMVIK